MSVLEICFQNKNLIYHTENAKLFAAVVVFEQIPFSLLNTQCSHTKADVSSHSGRIANKSSQC